LDGTASLFCPQKRVRKGLNKMLKLHPYKLYHPQRGMRSKKQSLRVENPKGSITFLIADSFRVLLLNMR